MPGSWFQNLQDNLNIDKQLRHTFAHLLHSYVNRSCFGHPLCDLMQDRQLSGLSPLSWSILHQIHNKIYSLNEENLLIRSLELPNQQKGPECNGNVICGTCK